MAVHSTVGIAYNRAKASVGLIGLPQPWAPFGTRTRDEEEGNTNDCCFFVTWLLKDNGGRDRGDYRNGSIKALRADRGWPELDGDATPVLGDLVLLRWEAAGLPDHIGFVTGSNPDGTVRTIEANTGPTVGVFTPCGVYRRTRFRQNIVGFIRPPYVKE